MKSKQSLLSVLTGFKIINDENSKEFKMELQNQNLEKEVVPIKYNSSVLISHMPDLSGLKLNNCYAYIDKRIYKEVSKILTAASLGEQIDEVCTILKHAYYRKILLSVNSNTIKGKKDFTSSLNHLLKFFSSEISSVKLQTNKKGQEFKTSDPELISLLIQSLKQTIFKDPFAASLIVDFDEKTDVFNNISPTIDNDAIISIAILIQTKTKFKHNVDLDKIILSKTISNKLCKLIYELLVTANLINDDVLDSEPHKFIRNRIKRYLETHPKILRQFDKNKGNHMLTFENLFPDVEHLEKIINIKNKLNQL